MKKPRSKKKQEEEFLEVMGMLYLVLSSQEQTQEVCKEVENLGDFYLKLFKSLEGEQNGDR
jgi:hypothetical protein